MPEGSKIEGESAELTLRAYKNGGLTVTLAMPGQQELGTKTFDLTDSDMFGSVTSVIKSLVIGLVIGMAPEVVDA